MAVILLWLFTQSVGAAIITSCTTNALALQSDYITQQTGISLATALPNASEADHWLMMAGFAFAHRSILTVYQSVGYFLQGDESRYPLLVAFLLISNL